MNAKQAEEIEAAVTDLMTNSFGLGLAQAAGQEVFVAGALYSPSELAEMQAEKSNVLAEAISEATEEKVK